MMIAPNPMQNTGSSKSQEICKKRKDRSDCYGGWTQAEHKAFIEGISGGLVLGFKIHDHNWKVLESLIPTRTHAQIKEHAERFSRRLERLVPEEKTLLEFVRSKPMEYLAEFNLDSQDPSDDCQEERKFPDDSGEKRKCVEEPAGTQKAQTVSQANRPRYLPTQSYVIGDTLKKITTEMQSLLCRLIGDIQSRNLDPPASTYWTYMYNNAIYMQQLINDVTVAHNSTIAYSQISGGQAEEKKGESNGAENTGGKERKGVHNGDVPVQAR